MMQNGAINSMMSGSGPTVFGLFENLTIYKTSSYAPNNGAINNKKPITKVNTNPIIIPWTLPA